MVKEREEGTRVTNNKTDVKNEMARREKRKNARDFVLY
jgi:hypothetical protein